MNLTHNLMKYKLNFQKRTVEYLTDPENQGPRGIGERPPDDSRRGAGVEKLNGKIRVTH